MHLSKTFQALKTFHPWSMQSSTGDADFSLPDFLTKFRQPGVRSTGNFRSPHYKKNWSSSISWSKTWKLEWFCIFWVTKKIGEQKIFFQGKCKWLKKLKLRSPGLISMHWFFKALLIADIWFRVDQRWETQRFQPKNVFFQFFWHF